MNGTCVMGVRTLFISQVYHQVAFCFSQAHQSRVAVHCYHCHALKTNQSTFKLKQISMLLLSGIITTPSYQQKCNNKNTVIPLHFISIKSGINADMPFEKAISLIHFAPGGSNLSKGYNARTHIVDIGCYCRTCGSIELWSGGIKRLPSC